jgi:LL-diaminopimelate aminotransferase
MTHATRLNLVSEYYFSTKLKEIAALNAAGKNIINLGIGSPDLPPHQRVVNALRTHAMNPKNHAYQSYVGLPVLREAIAAWYVRNFGVQLDAASEILPLMGSKEGIMHIAQAYLEAGDIALVPNPGYPTYRAAALLTGAEVVDYQLNALNHWLPDFEKMEAEIDLERAKIMFVNYPHMPTGAQATPTFFKTLVAFAKKHNILVVNDNPYGFILNDNPYSLLATEGAKECVLELNSLSKSHNMAGWRIGMVCGHKDLIVNVLRFKSNMDSGMFMPLQMAAVEALKLDKNWFDELNAIYKKRQTKVFELLDLLHCTYDSTQTGMFVWAKIPDYYKDGYALSDNILYNCNVFITPGSIFGSQGDDYVRVSLCADVLVFEQAIERINESISLKINVLAKLQNFEFEPNLEEKQVLNELILDGSHRKHQYVALKIQTSKDPKAVPYLRKALENGFEMYQYTCSDDDVIAKWFSWALYSIGTAEAIQVIKDFSESENEGIAKEMKYRLGKIKEM